MVDERQETLSRQRRNAAMWSAALLAGFLLRLVFLHFHPRFAGDTLTYGDLAHNLLQDHVYGFTEDVIRPTLIRLPGYPLFLAMCFGVFGDANYLAVLWVQIGVDLVTCVLLGVLAGRIWGRRAAWGGLWLAVLCPFTANYAAAALTETLSLFCVTLALFGLERWLARWREGDWGSGWVGVVGVALAGAMLLRPEQGLLATAVLPVMLWVRLSRGVKGLAPAAVALAIVVLPLLVWAGRNWRVFHVVQPLAPRYANDPGEDVPVGFQRWYRTWAIDFKSTVDTYWTYDGSVVRLEDLPPRAFDSAEQKEATRALFARYNAETSSTPEFDAGFAALASERVHTHPFRYYVALPMARLANMWLRPRTELMKMPIEWWEVRLHPKRSAFEIAYAALNALYVGLAVIGWWRWKRQHWTNSGPLTAAMSGFVLLRCALLLTVDNSEPRYVLECFPVVILLAGFALAKRSVVNG